MVETSSNADNPVEQAPPPPDLMEKTDPEVAWFRTTMDLVVKRSWEDAEWDQIVNSQIPRRHERIGVAGGRSWHVVVEEQHRWPTFPHYAPMTACGKRGDRDWRPGWANPRPKVCAKCLETVPRRHERFRWGTR